jgi:hypothetical protein
MSQGNETFEVQNANVVIPTVSQNPSGYQSRMVANYSYRLRNYHVRTIHRIKQALMLKSARLRDNRPVDSASTAICWILEQIENGAPEEKEKNEILKSENFSEKQKIENSTSEAEI